jgi:UDP-GlcNAc:undecaprenyl-phosphate GlcNAc-1-phosphate transferase
MDRPDGVRKIHHRETPLIGGLALLVPSFGAAVLYGIGFPHAPFTFTDIAASTLMLAVGVADDRLDLSARWRFSALIFIIFLAFSVNHLFVLNAIKLGAFGYHVSWSLGPFAAPVTALMIIGFVNAANMADGMNGQLLGSVVVWAGFIASYLGVHDGVAFITVACCGCVTLAFNLRGRLFAGSSGAYAASLFVGLGAIAAYRLANGRMSADLPLVWFWLPILDCVRLMARRLWEGRSPFAGDRNHIHHILLEYMSPPRALGAYLLMLIAPSIGIAIDETLGATVFLMALASYGTFVFLRESNLAHAKVARANSERLAAAIIARTEHRIANGHGNTATDAAAYWQRLAEAVRAAAGEMRDPVTRGHVMEIAGTYQRIADAAAGYPLSRDNLPETTDRDSDVAGSVQSQPA